PEPEVGCEPCAPDQRERGESAEQAADADRGVEVADSRLPEVEQPQGGDDEQHVHRSCNECLRTVEPDDEPKTRIADDGSVPCERLAQEAAADRRRSLSCASDADEQTR